MKTDHNLVWSEVHADKSITIGFTKKCIEERLPECFHVLVADANSVRSAGPMLVLETNDGLESIKSPFTGKISYFNSKARNYPDKLTETDTILTILPPGVEKAKPVEVKKPKVVGDWQMQQVQFRDIFAAPQAEAPQINPAEEANRQALAEFHARREQERRGREQAIQGLNAARARARQPR